MREMITLCNDTTLELCTTKLAQHLLPHLASDCGNDCKVP